VSALCENLTTIRAVHEEGWQRELVREVNEPTGSARCGIVGTVGVTA